MKKLIMLLAVALLVVGGTVAVTNYNAPSAAVAAEPAGG